MTATISRFPTVTANTGLRITVTVRSVYGNDMVYPACHASRCFAAIAGTKTLGHDTLSHIRSLGYRVDVAAPTLPR